MIYLQDVDCNIESLCAPLHIEAASFSHVYVVRPNDGCDIIALSHVTVCFRISADDDVKSPGILHGIYYTDITAVVCSFFPFFSPCDPHVLDIYAEFAYLC